MARQEISSGDVKVQQMPPIADIDAYEGDVVIVDPEVATKEYADALAFMENPVTIVLQPSTDKNAAMVFPIWVNGKPAEIHHGGQWREVGYLPVGIPFTTKRKYLEVIIRAKVTNINTQIIGPDAEQPQNKVTRFTSPIHSFTIMEDANPRGAAWASEMMRRNY